MPYKDNTITHHVRYARSTMVHEAGHAIAAWMCEREVELMAVAGVNGPPARDHRGRPFAGAGLVRHTGGLPRWEEVKGTLILRPERRAELLRETTKSIFIAGAGPAAEARVNHRSIHEIAVTGGALDWDESMLAIRPFAEGHADATENVREIWNHAANVIRCPEVWAAIAYLAQELEVADGRLTLRKLQRIKAALNVASVRVFEPQNAVPPTVYN